MSGTKLWYWELAQRGSGPDWHLWVELAPAGAEALDDAVRALESAGYTRIPANVPGDGLVTLIDSHHADTYIENSKEGAAQRNIMIYRVIEITTVHIHATYAYGWSEGEGDTLTMVLLGLLAAPGVALGAWRVDGGGEGYDYITVRQGVGGASLVSYLTDTK